MIHVCCMSRACVLELCLTCGATHFCAQQQMIYTKLHPNPIPNAALSAADQCTFDYKGIGVCAESSDEGCFISGSSMLRGSTLTCTSPSSAWLAMLLHRCTAAAACITITIIITSSSSSHVMPVCHVCPVAQLFPTFPLSSPCVAPPCLLPAGGSLSPSLPLSRRHQ